MNIDLATKWLSILAAALLALWADFREAMYTPWGIGLTVVLVFVVIGSALVYYLLEGDMFGQYPDDLQPEKPEVTEQQQLVNNLLAHSRRSGGDQS